MIAPAGQVATSSEDFKDLVRARVRRTARLTAVAGIIFSLLFALAYLLMSDLINSTDLGASLDDQDARRLRLAGLYVVPFAGIAFLWFCTALRMLIGLMGRPDDALVSNIQLGSALIFIGLYFVAGAGWGAGAASIEFTGAVPDLLLNRALPLLGNTVLFIFGMRMAAMFVFTTTTIARSGNILPGWFIAISYAVGLFLLLSVSFANVLLLVFPVWVLAISLFLLKRARETPATKDPAVPQGQGVAT